MNKGITLIALIISIIVLLIISGVTLMILIGENGVLTRAATMDQEFSKAEMEEAVGMIINELLIAGYEQAQSDEKQDINNYFNEQVVLEYLLNKENGLDEDLSYIRPDETIEPEKMVVSLDKPDALIYPVYYINVKNISNRSSRYGNGTDITNGNVYTIEVQSEKVKNDEGLEILKSTGVYDFKYYDDASKAEILSTLDFVSKK